MFRIWHAISLVGSLFLPFSVIGESTRSLVERGNAAYRAGSFDEALTRYEEASVEAPESATIYFNRGGALYQKGDFAAASDAFEQAALKSKKSRLGSLSKFNLGNCSFREAERQRDSDLKKSLEACEKSIRHYQEALQLDPKFKEAAENIEVVRLVMKSILDEQKKKQEEQQNQQNAMDDIAKKLRELIAKQEQAVEQNQQLQDARKQQGDSQAVRDQTGELATSQESVRNETSELSGEMGKIEEQMRQQLQQQNQGEGAQQPPMPIPQPGPSSPISEARKHVDTAVSDQVSSLGKLNENNVISAKPYQEKAAEELKEALAKLSDNQQEQSQQEQQSQENSQQEESKENQPKEQQQQQQQQQPQEDQSKAKEKDHQQAQAREEARSILDEEKENRERRQPRQPVGYRAVDKDW